MGNDSGETAFLINAKKSENGFLDQFLEKYCPHQRKKKDFHDRFLANIYGPFEKGLRDQVSRAVMLTNFFLMVRKGLSSQKLAEQTCCIAPSIASKTIVSVWSVRKSMVLCTCVCCWDDYI